MNWRYETWRKLYVREEGAFAALSYSARAAAAMLLKHVDARGRIYARAGEDIIDAICFRLGADRGERRQLRTAITDLLADGYLVQGQGWVGVRNFRRAHPHLDEMETEAAAIEQRTSSEPAANASPTGSECVAIVSRTGIEPVANEQRVGTEARVNAAEPLECVCAVPSEEFRAEISSSSPAPSGLARDPFSVVGGAARPPTATKPDWLRGWKWRESFGDAWATAHKTQGYGSGGDTKAARELEDVLAGFPEATVAALWERRQEIFAAFLGKQDPYLKQAKYPFSLLVARWNDFRPDVTPPDKPTADAPCVYHRGGRNSGKKALKHDIKLECAECRHLEVRAGPRPASAPMDIADLVRGYTHGG